MSAMGSLAASLLLDVAEMKAVCRLAAQKL